MQEQIENNRPGMTHKAGLFILIALMGAGAMLGGFASVFVWKMMTGQDMADMQMNLTNPAFVSPVRTVQTVLSVFMFLIPTYVAIRIINPKPLQYMGFRQKTPLPAFGWAVLLMIITMVIAGSLATLNELIPLTSSLKTYFTEMENRYMEQLEVMSRMESIADLLISLVVMAAVPAVVEEVFFRAGFQNMMQRSIGNIWVSIIITSLLFSAIHFSFYGLLARTAMGIMLGMMFATSKNIWVPILAHFVNNAVAVGQVYYLRMKGESLADGMDDKFPLWIGFIALLIVFFGIKFYEKSTKQDQEKNTKEVYAQCQV
jgi:membrane protease YdiL (CAAX protease family)